MAGRSSAFFPSSSNSQRYSRSGDVEKALGPAETRDIFQKMLSVVWVIDVGFVGENTRENSSIQGTGFCVHPEGYLLTAAHLFPNQITDIQVRKIDDIYFRSSTDGHVKLIRKFESFDIVVIKVEFSKEGDKNGFGYAKFGDGVLFRGQEVINIGHTMKWGYTSVRGEICYPCVNDVTLDDDASVLKKFDLNENLCTAWYETPKYLKAEDVIDQTEKDINFFRTDVPLIQINNLHCSQGSSGSPVFNSIGEIVGMLVFSKVNMDFAVHVSVLTDVFNISLKNYTENSSSTVKQKETKGKEKLKKRKGKKKKENFHSISSKENLRLEPIF